MEYESRPAEFERIFGYPMYKNGDLNYDRMILDIYASTAVAGINIKDREGPYQMPGGTNQHSRQRIMENFLKDKGVTVKTKTNVKVTPENFKKLSKDGYIIIGYHDGQISDPNGSNHDINGGHAMVVTGVTEDGKFIVSSWGEDYYIDPADINEDDSFSLVQYKS